MANCSKCGVGLIWLNTMGGKRVAIEANLKDLFELKSTWQKEPTPENIKDAPTQMFRPVKAYPAHDCPMKDCVVQKQKTEK